MHHFDLKDGALHAEGVPLELIADEVGTPAYVYSTATLKRHYGLLRAAADAHRDALGEALIAFAVKANSNLSVLATLARLGCGADTVSEGEIRRALAAGVPADRLTAIGYADTRPVDPNLLADGRARNRRVTILIDSNEAEKGREVDMNEGKAP